jgi:tetratricopeptide (TPR) repeat protein
VRDPDSPGAQALREAGATVVTGDLDDPASLRTAMKGVHGVFLVLTMMTGPRISPDGVVAEERRGKAVADLAKEAGIEHLVYSSINGATKLARWCRLVTTTTQPGIISQCAQPPLALVVAGARAATHPDFPLHRLATELRDVRDRLDVLIGDDPATDVRAVFSWSYRTLSAPAARLFRLLGVHPGPDIAAGAAASLAGLPPAEARRLLAELTRAYLIVEHRPGRYVFHDLLRAYAAELAVADPEPDALARMLDHYLHTAYTAAMLLNPARDPIPIAPPRDGVTPEELVDHVEAMTWFTAEHPVLYAAVTGWDSHAWQLAWTMVHFLDRRGLWHEWVAMQQTAVDAARRLADPAAQALAHRFLALPEIQLGRLDEAKTHLRHALKLYREVGDQVGQAHTNVHFGMAYVRQGRNATALEHVEQALALFRASHHRAGQALALNNIGWLRAQSGDYELALSPCEQASNSSANWATATTRRLPGTASGTSTATSAGAPSPSPATSAHSTCGANSTTDTPKPARSAISAMPTTGSAT